VIAAFTKYDQFRRDVGMKLEDQNPDASLDTEVERIFKEEYLANLKGSPPFVRLEGENFVSQLVCTTLISFPQGCTSLANGVPNLLKRLPMNSLASLASCSWLHDRIFPRTSITSGSESSLLEELMPERHQFYSAFVIPPRVQRSTALIHPEFAEG
jgi:hypothetical protein